MPEGGRSAALLARAGHAALLAVPGALLAYLSFNAGGFYPNTVAFAAIVVVQLLILRVTLADAPGAAVRAWALLPAGALALLAVWTLLSQGWSDAPGRALIEADRVLLYLLVFVLFATVARRVGDVRWVVRGVALGALVVCAGALATRVLPDVVSVTPNVADERLSWPLTYWNALGLVGTLGGLLLVHLASWREEPLVVRVGAAACLPLVAATVFFTFSRGSVVVAGGGLVVYAVLAFSPGLLAALATGGVASAIAVIAAYDRELLAEADRSSAAALAQADDMALIVLVCMVAAGAARRLVALVGRAGRGRVPERTAVLATRGLAAASLVVAVVVALAFGLPGKAVDAGDRFLNGKDATAQERGQPPELRDRFASAASPQRIEHWELAREMWQGEPLRGSGAGSFQTAWWQDRPSDQRATDAHSLYFETFAELGLVGLVLLLVALGTMLFAFVVRLRGPERPLYAALVAAALAWGVHAGLDWDWEMPATGAWLFACGGMALAAPAPRETVRSLPNGVRVVLALGLVAVAVAPVLIVMSQARLDRSIDALYADDCAAAVDEALSSTSALDSPPEPFQIVGYCKGASGRPQLGVEAMVRAVEADPELWETHFGLAVLRGEAGRDPRAAARRALELNPREPVVRAYVEALRTARPRDWPSVARVAHGDIFRSGALSFASQ